MQQQFQDNRPPPHSNPPVVPTFVVNPTRIFGPRPELVQCENCQQIATTTVVYGNGACVYMAAVGICIFFFPCFWVPFVIDACKDVHHMCPNCNAIVGTHKLV